MPSSSAPSMIELLAPPPGKSGGAAGRPGRNTNHGDDRFGNLLEEETDGASREDGSLLALQAQSLVSNLLMNLPGLSLIQSLPGPTPQNFTAGNSPYSGGVPGYSSPIEPGTPGPSEAQRNSPYQGAEPRTEPAGGPTEPQTADKPRPEESTRAERPTDGGQSERTGATSEREAEEAEAATKERADAAGAAGDSGDAENSEESGRAGASSEALASGASSSEEGPTDAEILKALNSIGKAEATPQQQATAQSTSEGVQAVKGAGGSSGAPSSGSATASANAVSAIANSGAASSNGDHGPSGQTTQGTTPVAPGSGPSETNGNAQTSATSESGPTSKSAPPPVPDQVLKTLRAAITNGEKEIQLRLDPPELGSLRLGLVMDGDQLQVTVQASSELSRKALEEALPDLRRLLEGDGVQVGEFVIQYEDTDEGSEAEDWDEGDYGADLPGAEELTEAEPSPETERAPANAAIFGERQVNLVA